MPLIDFRARPNTKEIMSLYDQPGREFLWKRWDCAPPKKVELPDFITNLTAAGVDRAVVTGRQVVAGEGIAFGTSNDYIADCVGKFPDRLIGFAGIDVSSGESAVAEIERAVKQLGMKGISIDPFTAKIYPNDRALYPVYEKAAELGIPVITTVGPLVGKFGDPYLFDEPTADFPTVKFVYSHAVWPQVTDWLALAFRRPNVFLEPSIYWTNPGCDPMWMAANGALSDQIIYASAFPFASLDSMDRVRSRWSWSDECWHKFTYANAARILGLDDAGK
jgi:predicted TIM-barrel fold metal-dependent hydrolase